MSRPITGSGSLSDSNVVKQDLGAVVVAGAGSTRTLGSAVKMSGLTINNGNSFVLAGNDLSFAAAAAVDNSGTFRLQGGEALTNVSSLGTAAGSVEYLGDGAGGSASFTVKDFGATDYYRLKIAGDASESFQVSSPLKLNSTLSHDSGSR